MNRIGIDLGGTKIEAILLSSTNKVVERTGYLQTNRMVTKLSLKG